jgi:hypothetical protein
LIGGSWMISLSLSRVGESAAGRDQLGELLRGITPWPSDGPRESTGKPAQPRYPLILADSLDLSRLTEGSWTYGSTTTTDGVLTESSFIGSSRIRMARGTYDGDPAWIVTTARSFRNGRATLLIRSTSTRRRCGRATRSLLGISAVHEQCRVFRVTGAPNPSRSRDPWEDSTAVRCSCHFRPKRSLPAIGGLAGFASFSQRFPWREAGEGACTKPACSSVLGRAPSSSTRCPSTCASGAGTVWRCRPADSTVGVWKWRSTWATAYGGPCGSRETGAGWSKRSFA